MKAASAPRFAIILGAEAYLQCVPVPYSVFSDAAGRKAFLDAVREGMGWKYSGPEI